MIRCKACGYITKEGKLGDRCPACGAPKSAFEPYNDPMSRPRRRVLNLQLHPIATHFPITFMVAALVFSIVTPIVPGEGHQLLAGTTKIITLITPLLVIITFWVGWWDGRIRFRKISNSQILKKKILYAISLFIVSVALAIVVWIGAFETPGFIAGVILLSAAAVVLVFLLGLLGTSILEAAFPGK
jgi:rubredoxin